MFLKEVQKLVLSDALALTPETFAILCHFEIVDTFDIVYIIDSIDIVYIVDMLTKCASIFIITLCGNLKHCEALFAAISKMSITYHTDPKESILEKIYQ